MKSFKITSVQQQSGISRHLLAFLLIWACSQEADPPATMASHLVFLHTLSFLGISVDKSNNCGKTNGHISYLVCTFLLNNKIIWSNGNFLCMCFCYFAEWSSYWHLSRYLVQAKFVTRLICEVFDPWRSNRPYQDAPPVHECSVSSVLILTRNFRELLLHVDCHHCPSALRGLWY
jgi:hypothetical protein